MRRPLKTGFNAGRWAVIESAPPHGRPKTRPFRLCSHCDSITTSQPVPCYFYDVFATSSGNCFRNFCLAPNCPASVKATARWGECVPWDFRVFKSNPDPIFFDVLARSTDSFPLCTLGKSSASKAQSPSSWLPVRLAFPIFVSASLCAHCHNGGITAPPMRTSSSGFTTRAPDSASPFTKVP